MFELTKRLCQPVEIEVPQAVLPGTVFEEQKFNSYLSRHDLQVIDPLMAQRMATWVLWGVINVQRKCDEYWAAQRACRWDKGIENFRNIDNAELRVGVMGAGVMGGAVLDTLLKLRYSVSSWTRRPRDIDQVNCFSGGTESPFSMSFLRNRCL